MSTLTENTGEYERRISAFIDAYAITGNSTSAAIQAGYSQKNAKQQGSFLLTNPEINIRAREAREAWLAKKAEQHEAQANAINLAADDAINMLASIVKGDLVKSGQAKVQAAIALLDRAGHKPVDRVVATNINTTMPNFDEIQRKLAGILERAGAPVATRSLDS